MGPGPFVLRSSDGVHFEEVDTPDRHYFGSQTLRMLVPFKGRLFTSPVGRCGGADTEHDEMIVLESADPANGGWRPVSEPYFGDSNNLAAFDLAVSNGFLYAGTMNPYEGYQIWKTDGEGPPPYRWTRVLSHGAHRGNRNEVAISMCTFRGSLYVGSAVYNCGYDRMYKIGPASPELIRIDPDDSWDLIVGEPRRTPDGLKVPLSGLGPGFDNPFAGYIWRLCVHEGWLYAATCVWTPWAPFARRRNWPEPLNALFKPTKEETFLRDFGGFDLWRSRDGHRWMPVTRNGFGNPFNCGIRAMVSAPPGLFVGTVNQFGPEVAVKRVAGWRYEPNDRGGIEVWLGTHDRAGQLRAAVPIEERGGRVTEGAITPHRDRRNGDLVDDYYGHSGWRNVGFWRADIDDVRRACENLMEEILAFTRPTPPLKAPRYPDEEEVRRWLARRSEPVEGGTRLGEAPLLQDPILDVGCGLGATTRYLLRYYAPRAITGVTARVADLRGGHANGSGIRFLLTPLPELRLDSNAFSTVICVEGPSRWGERRRLLTEIHRVLRPGGQMVGSDLLPADDADGLKVAASYRTMIEEIGFNQVRVVDVTSRCWLAFRRDSREFLRMKRLEGAGVSAIRDAWTSMPGGRGRAMRYLLISAVKAGDGESG